MDEFEKWSLTSTEALTLRGAWEAGREAGMWEAATDARLIDWLEKALFAKSWNAVIDSGSRTHWRIVEGHRHITAKMEGATFRDAILSAIGGGK